MILRILWPVLLLAASAAHAQAPEQGTMQQSPQLVDRIVAIVDEEAILLSDLEREVETYHFEAQAYGHTITDTDLEIRQQMLDNLIEVKLLVAQAKLDGMEVSEEELDQAVANSMQELIDRFGSRNALDRELRANGMTFEDLDARNRDLMRNRIYTSRMVGRHIRPNVEVMEAEVESFYQGHKDEVPSKPEQITLANILIVPQPSEDTRKQLGVRLGEIQAALAEGLSFEDVARRFSEGPNASRGGLVGSFARGDLFNPILEEQAWQIPVEKISQPITTELGVHLILVTDRDEQQLTLHQIMLRVDITEADREATLVRAQQVVAFAREGQDFAELARSHSDDPGSRDEGGLLGTFAPEQLSPQFTQAIAPLQPGEVSDPIPGSAGYFILKLVNRQGGGLYTFEEVKDRLREMVFEEKTQAELDRFLKGLRKKFHIQIKA